MWDGKVEPVSQDQILRRERGQEIRQFSCSADHEQDWQPYPAVQLFAISVDQTYSKLGISPGRDLLLIVQCGESKKIG